MFNIITTFKFSFLPVEKEQTFAKQFKGSTDCWSFNKIKMPRSSSAVTMLTRNVLQRYFNVQMFGIALKLLAREKKLFPVSSLSIFTKIKSKNSTSESTTFPSGKQKPVHEILNAALRNYFVYCLTKKTWFNQHIASSLLAKHMDSKRRGGVVGPFPKIFIIDLRFGL